MADMFQPTEEHPIRKATLSNGKLSARFRQMNILILAVAFCTMAIIMSLLFGSTFSSVSSDYTKLYGISSAEALSARIDRNVWIVKSLAGSQTVIEWMLDEEDVEKKALAFQEMEDILGELYSVNLYVGLEGSHNEYNVIKGSAADSHAPFDTLETSDPDDAWYFSCIASEREYVLSLGIDHVQQQKRVWIDYNVIYEGELLGVISTGLEFSHVLGELFTHFPSEHMRGLIVDRYGRIHMDSSLMGDSDYLKNDYEISVFEEFTDTPLLKELETYLASLDGIHEMPGLLETVELQRDRYRFLSIAPVVSTDWMVVVLSDGLSLFDFAYFAPLLITALVLLFIVAVVISATNYRLIFMPIIRLNRSLDELRENNEGNIYGTDRHDELGKLANTIQDLFIKANVDTLTGLYNRRFMENNIEHILGMLSRSKGMLGAMMIDIDHFKKYNDAYGHEQGDECLRSVAQALSKGVMRASDFIARYGGEEFVVFLADIDEAGACVVAEKLLENVRALEIPHAGNTAAPHVTVSIGVTTDTATFRQKWEDYIKRADEAMYASKEGGRNRYTFKTSAE